MRSPLSSTQTWHLSLPVSYCSISVRVLSVVLPRRWLSVCSRPSWRQSSWLVSFTKHCWQKINWRTWPLRLLLRKIYWRIRRSTSWQPVRLGIWFRPVLLFWVRSPCLLSVWTTVSISPVDVTMWSVSPRMWRLTKSVICWMRSWMVLLALSRSVLPTRFVYLPTIRLRATVQLIRLSTRKSKINCLKVSSHCFRKERLWLSSRISIFRAHRR